MILTVLDTETTGLDLLKHEVIEVGMMKVHVDKNFNHSKVECYEAKIKPRYIKRASPQALKVNGYTTNKWRSAVKFADISGNIKEWIDQSDYLIGQNLLFDYNFINAMFDRDNIERPVYPRYYDTKWMADKLIKEGKLKRSGLDYLCENYNIPILGRAHTALTDVLRTYELFKRLRNEVKVESLSFKKPYDPFGDQKNG
jgi:DNA polymerase III epsilon subunit-like protein